MPKIRAVRLRHLLILLTALGLLPIAVIGAWSISKAVDQQQRELERSMLDLSRALASAVDAELDSAISSLRAMSYNPVLVKGDLPAFYAIASEAVRARPDWAAVVLTNGNGQLIFKTLLPFGASDGEILDPDSLARAISERTAVIGRISKGQATSHAVPVRVPVITDGKVSYVLTAAIRPDRILDIIQRQKVPDSWVISVQDADNLRVARSRDHEKTVATGISSSLSELISGGKSEGTGISRTLEGTEAITAFTRVPRHNWMVVIGAPTAHLRQALIQNFTMYAAGIAGSLAICIALAIYISRRIDAAIGRLQRQAAQLGQGEPVHVAPHPIHEVNQMGLALQAASEERIAIEHEREALMASLNAALARAEEASQAKDNFLAVLGHELRNPLAPMVTALDLMEIRGETSNLRERRIMQRQVDHMKRLVDDLLDVSRITQGKLEIRKEPVSLRSVVERAIEAVHPAVAARGRGIVVNMTNDVWVNGDETRLVQVLTNLLANALRFDPKGEISVSVTGSDWLVRMTVRDEGAGMPVATAEKVFRPFYQAPQSLARSSGGLGLGLAIVRSIVELHGGSVSAASDGVGKGSTFEVLLPMIAAPEQAQLAGKPLRQASQHARILVVDDNVDAAQTIAEVLKIAGHHVQVTHDARAALEALAGFMPDVAFVDIGLPGMDGFELAKSIRTQIPAWHGKLVALTGYGQPADKSRSAEAGFDMHLTKPVDTSDLLLAAG